MQGMHTMRTIAKGLFALSLLAAASAAYADYSVGRISVLQGAVSAQTPGDPESHRAALNDVVAEGDQLATSADATAELQFAGVVLELGPSTVIALTRVQTDGFSVFVERGALAVGRSNDEAPATVTLQGTQLVAYAQTAGRYRLDVDAEVGDEHLSVWLGRADAQVESRELQLFAGQSLEVSPGLAGAMTVGSSGNLDALDMTLADRLGLVRASLSTQRLSGDWVGAAALDDQGSWLEVSSVGPLWVPFFLPDNWAPYRSGHWAWNGVWGWTWVDDLPWSYVSFHFGRWIWWNNRWAWSPNGRIPLFSPAGFCPPGLRPPMLPNPRRLAGVVPAVIATGPAQRARPGTTGIVASVLSRPRVPGRAVGVLPNRATVFTPSAGPTAGQSRGVTGVPSGMPSGLLSTVPSGAQSGVPPSALPGISQGNDGPRGRPVFARPLLQPAPVPASIPLAPPPRLPVFNPALTSGAVPLAPPMRLPPQVLPSAFPAAGAAVHTPPAAPINLQPNIGSAPALNVNRPPPNDGRSAPHEEPARAERPPANRQGSLDGHHDAGHIR